MIARARGCGTSRAGSLSETAYLVIRERILRGELPLGSALSRRKIASELGMSLLPVSEALQRLQRDGLAESTPRVGTRVYQPTAEDVAERFEVREALECQAARLFAEKASGRERAELRQMAETLDDLYRRRARGEKAPDFLFEVQRYHSALHLRIAECTGCRALCAIIEKNNLLIFTWLSDVAAHRPLLPDDHHRVLVEGISAGDPERADGAMREHLRCGRAAILKAFAEGSPG
jgi:DNA-binding GntR family transcriptional regulator